MQTITVSNWAKFNKNVTLLVIMETPFNKESIFLYADCEIDNADNFKMFLDNLVNNVEDLNTELNEDYTMTDFLDNFSTFDIMDAIEETGDIGVYVIKYY